MKKYNATEDKVIVFDDKPSQINEISKNMKGIVTIKIEFEGILKLAWSEKCTPTHIIKTLNEVKRIIDV